LAEKCFCDEIERNVCKILTNPASQGRKGGYQKYGFWASPDPAITTNILFWAKYHVPRRKYHVPRTFKTTLLSNNLYKVLACGALVRDPWTMSMMRMTVKTSFMLCQKKGKHFGLREGKESRRCSGQQEERGNQATSGQSGDRFKTII